MTTILQSQIEGAFNGWSGETVFRLTNGQVWQQTQYAYFYKYIYRPRVTISQGNGKHFLHVEGIEQTVPVRRISMIESQIDGAFEGWDGETVFCLTNGQIWQQSSYAYMYHYCYRPTVYIYEAHGGYVIKVEGVNDTLPVKRIR